MLNVANASKSCSKKVAEYNLDRPRPQKSAQWEGTQENGFFFIDYNNIIIPMK